MKSNIYKIVSAIAILALVTLACALTVPDVSGDPTQPPVDIGGDNGGSGGGELNNNGSNNGGSGNNGGGSGRSLIDDDFEGRNSNWGVGTDVDSAVEYVNGGLQFLVFSTNLIVYSGPNDTTYKNVYMEVDVQNDSADPNAAFGIICNQQFMDDEFYYAYITPDGEYGIFASQFIEDDIQLASGQSDLIPQNASSYHIALDCGNGVLTLYVNGQQVASAEDTQYVEGTIALFASTDEEPSGANVTFDNFVMSELP